MNVMTAKILITMEHEEQRKELGDCLKQVGHEVNFSSENVSKLNGD